MAAARQLELPLGISWACQRTAVGASPADDMAWLTLRAACVRALTPAWLLQPVAAGAVAVAVTPCASCVIPSAAGDARAQLVRSLLGLPILEAASGIPMWRPTTSDDRNWQVLLREPAASANALVRLGVGTAKFVDSPVSPLGAVECDTSRCTACGLCAQRCPTGALAVHDAPGSRTLAFSHSACAACGACTTTCPEAALTLRRGVDPAALTGSRTLAATAVHECATCRAALPTPALVARLAAAGVTVPDDGICGDCRSAGRTSWRTTATPALTRGVPAQP
jgi:ferredoxin